MAFGALEEILEQCSREGEPFWRVVLKDDINERNVTEEESIRQMEELWDAMLLAAALYDKKLNSHSGLTGGDGGRMEVYVQKGDTLSGPFIGQVIAGALQMGESNACMKRIVAAPTAGACGVLPAVLVPYFREKKASVQQIIEALNLEEINAEEIATDAPLFGEGLGLDSIDALEITLLLEKHYGIRLANPAEAKPIFHSVATLADYIRKNRK